MAGEGVVPRGLPLLCAAFAIRAGAEGGQVSE